jgi:hypothetical protein
MWHFTIEDMLTFLDGNPTDPEKSEIETDCRPVTVV